MKKFHLSEIIVLHASTLTNKELFHNFDHNCKMVYYNGTVTLFWDLKYCLGGYNATVTLFWDFKIACEEWQRYINSGIAKRGNKI